MKATTGKRAGMFGGNIRYRCRYCSHSNTTALLMRQHVMSRHLNYRPYSCLLCDFTATRSCYILQHVRHRHRNMSYKKRKYSYVHDKVMDQRLKNGYYSVDLSESSMEDVTVKLQDHTYTAVSLADTKKASDLCQNNDSTQSCGGIPSDNGTLPKMKTTAKEARGLCTDDNGNFYHCAHCTFLAVSRKSLRLHISQKHRKPMPKSPENDAPRHSPSEVFISHHRNHCDIGDNSQAVAVVTLVNDYFCTSSQSNSRPSTVLETDFSSSEADTRISALTSNSSREVPCEVISDIIYCCESCPSSFSTPEALASHKCTSSNQQSTV